MPAGDTAGAVGWAGTLGTGAGGALGVGTVDGAVGGGGVCGSRSRATWIACGCGALGWAGAGSGRVCSPVGGAVGGDGGCPSRIRARGISPVSGSAPGGCCVTGGGEGALAGTGLSGDGPFVGAGAAGALPSVGFNASGTVVVEPGNGERVGPAGALVVGGAEGGCGGDGCRARANSCPPAAAGRSGRGMPGVAGAAGWDGDAAGPLGRPPPVGAGLGVGTGVPAAGCVDGAVGGAGGAADRSRASVTVGCFDEGLSRSWNENRPDEGVVGMLYRASRARRAASGAGGVAGLSAAGAGGWSGVSVGAGVASGDGAAATPGLATTAGASLNRAVRGGNDAEPASGACPSVGTGLGVPPEAGVVVWGTGTDAGGPAGPDVGAPPLGGGACPDGAAVVAPLAALLVLTGGGGDGARGVAATTMAAIVAPGNICGRGWAGGVGAVVWGVAAFSVAGLFTAGLGACVCGGARAAARGRVPATCGGIRRVMGRSVGSGVGVSTDTSPAAVRMVALPSSCATTWPDTISARSSPASLSGKARIMTSASGTRPGPAGAGPVGAVVPVRPGGRGADMGSGPPGGSTRRQLLRQRHDVMRRIGGGGTDQQRRLRLDAFAHLHVTADDTGQLRALA